MNPTENKSVLQRICRTQKTYKATFLSNKLPVSTLGKSLKNTKNAFISFKASSALC